MKKSLISGAVSLAVMFVMVVVVSMMYLNMSYGWFSSNNEVGAEGIKVNPNENAVVVIGNRREAMASINSGSLTVSVDPSMNEEHIVTTYFPCTHDFRESGTSATYLRYNPYPTEIDVESGLGWVDEITSEQTSVTLFDVPENNNSAYYVDYVIYISSYGKAIEGADLIAEITDKKQTDNYKGATSVDFFREGTYVGTLNLAGYDNHANNHSTVKTSLKVGEEIDIPTNKVGSIEVTMRCYFDGALLMDDEHTFITRSYIKVSEEENPLRLHVRFTVDGGREIDS